MRLALDVPEDGLWSRYTDDLNLLADTPDITWVELAGLLKTQALEAINRTEPKY